MNKTTFISGILMGLFLAIATPQPVFSQQTAVLKYIIQNDSDVAKEEPGTHRGGGKTIGFNFFEAAKNLKTVFRKRILKPGSAIGYHLQNDDEIYYIISGTGLMKMNGKSFIVKSGDAILTRQGSKHGLAPDTDNDLVMLIVYEKK